MKYILVLQFPARHVEQFDELVDLEDALRSTLDDDGTVDGHDFGSGEMNIFILTNEPRSVFARAKKVVDSKRMLDELKAAYRANNEDDYTILWPENCISEFSVK